MWVFVVVEALVELKESRGGLLRAKSRRQWGESQHAPSEGSCPEHVQPKLPADLHQRVCLLRAPAELLSSLLEQEVGLAQVERRLYKPEVVVLSTHPSRGLFDLADLLNLILSSPCAPLPHDFPCRLIHDSVSVLDSEACLLCGDQAVMAGDPIASYPTILYSLLVELERTG